MMTSLFLFGKMSKYIKIIVLSAIIQACGNSSNEGFVDEIHRPKDWAANLDLHLDSTINKPGFQIYYLNDASNSATYDGIVDQLFDFAFSGDADVYSPDILGEISTSKLTPKQLHDRLNKRDTVFVQSLENPNLFDTIEVDLSFKKELVSVLIINGNLKHVNQTFEFFPVNALIGDVSYSEYGEYKGDRPEFYVGFGIGQDHQDYDFSMEIRSDTNGVFHLESFKDFVAERALNLNAGDNIAFRLSFNFRERKMVCSNLLKN